MRFKIKFLHYCKPEEQEFNIVANDESLPKHGDLGYYDRVLTASQVLRIAEALELAARSVIVLDRANQSVKVPEAKAEPETDDAAKAEPETDDAAEVGPDGLPF